MSAARTQDNVTKVGVGLVIIRDNTILLGRRLGTHGAGEYAPAGGHLEHLESFEACGRRELAEEAGPDIKIKHLRFLCLSNLKRYAPKHYVNIGLVAEWVSGEPRVTEPDKIDQWQWWDLDHLPSPLFGVLADYLEAYRTGRDYFDN